MPKKKKKKKVQKTDKTGTSTKGKKTKKSGYKRGSLGKAIYEYFDKVTLEKATYEKSLEIAKGIMPTTKFNKNHFSWYKNKYRELRDL